MTDKKKNCKKSRFIALTLGCLVFLFGIAALFDPISMPEVGASSLSTIVPESFMELAKEACPS